MFGNLRSVKLKFMTPEQRVNSLASDLGFSVVESASENQPLRELWDYTHALVRAGDFRGFRKLWQKNYTNKTCLPSGKRSYSIIENAVGSIFNDELETPQQMESRLPLFEQIWRENKEDPIIAGLFCELLFSLGYAWRGTDTADNVTDEGWQKMSDYVAWGHDVLETSIEKAENCAYWHRALFRIGLSDGAGAPDLYRRFNKAVAFDPNDIEIHLDRAYQLTNRWHGSDKEIETFAREAVARTRAELGDQMYARIYYQVLPYEDVRRSFADWKELKHSFDDWMRRNPGDFAANAYAAMATEFDDYDHVRWLFNHKTKHVVLDAWPSPEHAAYALEQID